MSDCLYTPALAETICKRIAEGESLRAICRDSGMPTEGAVRAWARDNRDGFGARYRLARELEFEFCQCFDCGEDRAGLRAYALGHFLQDAVDLGLLFLEQAH